MKKRRKAGWLVGLVLVSTLCYGQQEALHSNSPEALVNYQKAQAVIVQHDYEPAKNFLKEAVRLDPNFAEAFQTLGDIQRIQKDYSEAIFNYKKVIRLSPNFLSTTYYSLAEADFASMHYAESILYFELCLKQEGLAQEKANAIHRFLDNAYFGKKSMDMPLPFHPINLGASINTESDEYLPSLTVDDSTLLFTRKVLKNEDFYVSILGPTGQWKRAVYLPGNINRPEYNEGAGSIAADGKSLYFTLCDRPGVIGRCDLYTSVRQTGHWGTPQNLGPPVNTEGWESQPSISSDGNTLYFSSSRPGGYGGFDIWKSVRSGGGRWAPPVNLGPDINTSGNEISPFIHPDNETLYFSSDGWVGMGGKDLYVSRKNGSGGWIKPVNLGYPLNTAGEESSLIVSADGKTGLFASNSLKGFGGYDLYSFELYPEAKPNRVSYIKGVIQDSLTRERLTGYVEVVRLRDGEIVYAQPSDKVDGSFLAGLKVGEDYSFHVTKKGYLLYSQTFSLSHPGKKNDLQDAESVLIPLRKIGLGKKDVLKNIFFETGSFVLKPESKGELTKMVRFMKINPRVKIEISGHTDNEGADQTNMILSENRARAVQSYLIHFGPLDPSRFTYKGYGKTQPIGSNQSETGRAANRRTEFKITEF